MNDLIKQLQKIEEYFNSSPTPSSEPYFIECEHNALLTMAICIVGAEHHSPNSTIPDEPTIYFPNDEQEYHVHFDNVSELLKTCRKIFAETIVLEISEDNKSIKYLIDLTDVNDRRLFESKFNEPESIANHENYEYVREVKIASWKGTKSGVLNIDNINDLMQ